MSNKIKILLAVSVLLNFLLVGISIGHMGKHRMYKRGIKHNFTEYSDLSPEKQNLIMDQMSELRKQNRPVRKEINKVRNDIADILQSPEFDENLYNQKVDELHELHGKMAKSLAESVKELANQLSPEEREFLSQMLRKKHHGKHRKIKSKD